VGGWTGKPIDIDFVDPNAEKPHPGVDCDAGNLCLSKFGELTLKVDVPLVSLEKSISHVKHRKFVFFYDYNKDDDKQMCIQRLTKYFERGWQCLSPVTLPELSRYKHLCVPKPKYTFNCTHSDFNAYW